MTATRPAWRLLEALYPAEMLSREGSQGARGAVERGVRALYLIAAIVGFAGLVVSIAALLVMLGFTTAAVFGRYTGLFTLSGSDEVGGYMMAAVLFLALGHNFRTGNFIHLPVVVRKLPPRPRTVVEVALHAIALVVSAILTYYFWRLVSTDIKFQSESTGIVSIKLWIPELVLPIGAFTLTLQVAASLLARLVFGPAAVADSAVVPEGELV